MTNKLQRDTETQLFGREAAITWVMSNVSLSPKMMKWLPFWTAQAEIRAEGFFWTRHVRNLLPCLDSAGKAHLFNVSCKKTQKKTPYILTHTHTCVPTLSL